MAKRIICKNEDGVQVEFNYSFEPFFLVSVDGIYTVSNNVVTSENTMVDGSTYQGSTTKQRNIVITAQMERDYQANRDLLYKCFKPKSTGLFTYIEGSETRVIDYKVEGIDIDEAGVVRNFSISLLCPDPFFRDLEDISVSMASWTGLFEWPHEFLEEKEPFAERTAEVLKEIENDRQYRNNRHAGSGRTGNKPGRISCRKRRIYQDWKRSQILFYQCRRRGDYYHRNK